MIAPSGAVGTLLAAAEIIILSLAGFAFFRRSGNTFSEAGAYGLATALMALSLFFQLGFLLRKPLASLFAEVPLTAAALGYLVHRRSVFRDGLTAVRGLFSQHRLAGTLMMVMWSYMAVISLTHPPAVDHWRSLGQLFVFDHFNSLSPPEISGTPPAGLLAWPPLNTLILPHLFLRFQSDIGIGLLGFLAYLTVAFCVYALCRRYAWPPTAFTVSFMVISMPRVVYQATSPGYEIIPAAVALFCLLAVYRTVESPNTRDLYLLVSGTLFLLVGTPVDLAFPLILVSLAAILLFRRHGTITWWHLVAERPWRLVLFSFPFLVFSQLGYVLCTISSGIQGTAQTNLPGYAFNPDGIQGALANALRYLLQSAHFTLPVDRLLQWATGFSISGSLQRLYDLLVAPVLNGKGAVAAFRIIWVPDQQLSWFGPFAFLLVFPALLYAAKRAPRRLKAIAVALGGYFFLVALIPAWQPENVRYFDVFFICGSLCVAYLLPPWRFSKRGQRILLTAGAGLLLYASLFNSQKSAFRLPVFQPKGVPREAAQGSRSDDAVGAWKGTRCQTAACVYGDDRLEKAGRLISKRDKPWLIHTNFALTYPFLLRFPDAEPKRLAQITPEILSEAAASGNLVLVFVDCHPPPWLNRKKWHTLWQSDPDTSALPGALLHLR